MKKKNIFTALLLLIILLMLTTSTASAIVFPTGAKGICENAKGVYDPDTKTCYWRASWAPNFCFPEWDKYVWNPIFKAYQWRGCVDLRDAGITSPTGGVEYLFPNTFSYDPGTCDGRCRVITTGLTGDAKAALGDLPGKVIGKAYVQILDLEGNPTTGNFKLCMKAKNAKNPAFFRYNPSGWQYFGGFWSGKKFCVAGTMGGNYVLVNIKD